MDLSDRIAAFKSIMGGRYEESLYRYLYDNGFFTAPASTKYHGAYEGGLFDHSFLVTKRLIDLTNNNYLEWEDPRSPYIVGMFHDLCKIDSYKHPIVMEDLSGKGLEDPNQWEYNNETLFKGHGIKSVLLLSQFFSLTEEEIACITYHMGAFTDKEEWRDYTRAVNKYPNVLWTHTADMLASHVEGI